MTTSGVSRLLDDLLRRGPRLGLLAVVALALVPASAAAAPNDTVIVSRSSGSGTPDANESSSFPSISADGRFVAFGSLASNLIPGDANGRRDVFVRDHQADTTSVVSRSSGDGPPDANSDSGLFPASVSGDGRFVAFESFATNLVPFDLNAAADVFVRDRQTGTTTVVSRSSGLGSPDGLGISRSPSMSANGRFVAFVSDAPNLVSSDVNASTDVFVRDLQENTTRIVSRSSGDGPPDANNSSDGPRISGDGRFVAFHSDASNLVPGDANGTVDVFVRDLQENTTRIVSRSNGDGPPDANSSSFGSSVSGDGRFVAFYSLAGNLVPGDANASSDVFVRDRQTGTTTVVSRSSGAGPPDADDSSVDPSISADGRFVSFGSLATNLVAGDTNQVGDVFRRELAGAGPAPPGTPAVSVGDVTVTEGDSGTVDAALTVSLSAASASEVRVDYGSADETTTAPGDYVPVSGTLVFAAGETSKTVAVAVKGDTLDEPDERFAVNLSNPQNATVTDSQAVGTIADDDPPAAISVGDVSVTEGDSGTVDAALTVSLSAASAKVVSVDFATADDSATQPGDYESRTGTLVFAPGETSKAVTVAVKGDALDEPDERFAVNLSNPQNATVTDSQGVGTITDDDPPVGAPNGGGGGAPAGGGGGTGGGGTGGGGSGGGGSVPGSVPGLPPGAAGSRCGDLTRPRSSVSKRSRLTRKRIGLGGRTIDRECSPQGEIVRTERPLARVEVSVGMRVGKRCRYLTSDGGLSPTRSCGSPLFVRAKTVSFDRKTAKTIWRLAQRVRLRRGRYSAYVRGVDRDGNVEQAQRPTNRASFQLR